jgi:hypothetical protein
MTADNKRDAQDDGKVVRLSDLVKVEIWGTDDEEALEAAEDPDYEGPMVMSHETA